MNEDFITKNRVLILTSLAIITFITFYPIFFTGFGCADDLQNYFVARWGKVWENAKTVAGIAGRFYYLIVCPVYALPFAIDNIFMIKLFQVVPLVACFILFARILFLITRSREVAFLYFLLSVVLMQVSGYTSLFVNYPFYYTFSFAILLTSYILLLSYLRNRKKRDLVLSSLLFISGLLFYETYLFFFIIIAFTIISYHFRKNDPVREKFRASVIPLLPFVSLTVLYLAVYFIYRIYHPSQYDGTTFAAGGVSLHAFFNVLWSFSYTSFPLTVFSTNRDLFDEKSLMVAGHSPVVSVIIMNARVEWLIKGILAAWCAFLVLMKLPKVRVKSFLGVVLLSGLLIFFPHVPLALTPKYTYYASLGMIGYITTYFSYFGVVLLVTFLLAFLINLFNRVRYLKIAAAVIMVIGLFICSILIDYSNDAVERDIRGANLRFKAVDEMVRSEVFLSIPAGSAIFAPDLYNNPYHSANNLTDQSFDWRYYIKIRTGVEHQVIRNKKEFVSAMKDTERQSYYLSMNQALKDEDILLTISKMDKLQKEDTLVPDIVNNLWVLYYSKHKIFTVSFNTGSRSSPKGFPLKINHIADTIQPGKNVEFTIYNTQRYRTTIQFMIKADQIDPESIRVSNMVNPGNKVFYL